MAFDGIFLNGVLNELKEKLLTGRVVRIHQPEKDEIHMLIRRQGENYKLLLSASASHPKIQITSTNKENPAVPPLFCMVLRKHLTGNRIVSIDQPSFDRIAVITFEGLNEMGDVEKKQLITEIMGKHSNIILINQSGKIIDSIKRVNMNISRVREVVPGGVYTFPPSKGKLNPLDADEDFLGNLIENAEGTMNPARMIINSFIGTSKSSAEEIVYMATKGTGDRISVANCSKDELIAAFKEFFTRVKAGGFTPVMLLDGNKKPKDILPFQYNLYSAAHQTTFESFSQLLDAFYSERDSVERIKQRSASLVKLIKTNIERCEKKIALQSEEIIKSKKAEEYRLMGELLTANLHAVKNGVKEISVVNYYDPEGKTTVIPLDPTKTPGQNAQAFYKKYNKAKTAFKKYSKMLEETKVERDYFESILESLNMAVDEQDILEIREELVNEGYIKKNRNTNRNNNKSPKQSRPYHYLSSDNFDIYVGRNNKQNDYLTLKLASGTDIWMHTKDIPGSHVIIKSGGRTVPETTLLEAANLAAYYSKGRLSSNVPVDYCLKKYVRKPNSAKPGMVIYEQHNTVYITPSEDEIKKLTRL